MNPFFSIKIEYVTEVEIVWAISKVQSSVNLADLVNVLNQQLGKTLLSFIKLSYFMDYYLKKK